MLPQSKYKKVPDQFVYTVKAKKPGRKSKKSGTELLAKAMKTKKK